MVTYAVFACAYIYFLYANVLVKNNWNVKFTIKDNVNEARLYSWNVKFTTMIKHIN